MKNHYYVSIPIYGHRVFKYVGEVPIGKEYNYTEAFKRFGPSGVPGPDEQEGPYDVQVFPSHRGDQVDDRGLKYPKKYVPKQIILTKRIRQTVTCTGGVHRHRWTKKSCQNSEDIGVQFAHKHGFMLHYFGVGDEDAWVKAVERHIDIEESYRKLKDQLGTVCTLPTEV